MYYTFILKYIVVILLLQEYCCYCLLYFIPFSPSGSDTTKILHGKTSKAQSRELHVSTAICYIDRGKRKSHSAHLTSVSVKCKSQLHG